MSQDLKKPMGVFGLVMAVVLFVGLTYWTVWSIANFNADVDDWRDSPRIFLGTVGGLIVLIVAIVVIELSREAANNKAIEKRRKLVADFYKTGAHGMSAAELRMLLAEQQRVLDSFRKCFVTDNDPKRNLLIQRRLEDELLSIRQALDDAQQERK
jgi:DMSO/TMAO reductase YedYZ heme-binding membrane subunit